jgi:hypothetical protein
MSREEMAPKPNYRRIIVTFVWEKSIRPYSGHDPLRESRNLYLVLEIMFRIVETIIYSVLFIQSSQRFFDESG